MRMLLTGNNVIIFSNFFFLVSTKHCKLVPKIKLHGIIKDWHYFI